MEWDRFKRSRRSRCNLPFFSRLWSPLPLTVRNQANMWRHCYQRSVWNLAGNNDARPREACSSLTNTTGWCMGGRGYFWWSIQTVGPNKSPTDLGAFAFWKWFFSAFDSVNAKRCVPNVYTVGSHGSENNRLLFKMQRERINLHRVMFCRTPVQWRQKLQNLTTKRSRDPVPYTGTYPRGTRVLPLNGCMILSS